MNWNFVSIPPSPMTNSQEVLLPHGLLPGANELMSAAGLPPVSLAGQFKPLQCCRDSLGSPLLDRLRLGAPCLVRHEKDQSVWHVIAKVAQSFESTPITILMSTSEARAHGQNLCDYLDQRAIGCRIFNPDRPQAPGDTVQVLVSARKHLGYGEVFRHCSGILIVLDTEGFVRKPQDNETFDLSQIFDPCNATYIQSGTRLLGFLRKGCPQAVEKKVWPLFGLDELLLNSKGDPVSPGRVWFLGRTNDDRSKHLVEPSVEGAQLTALSRATVWNNLNRNRFIAKSINRIRGAAGRQHPDKDLPRMAEFGKHLGLIVLNTEHQTALLQVMADLKVKAPVFTFAQAAQCKHELPKVLLRCDGGVGALPFLNPEDGGLVIDLLDRSPSNLFGNFKKRRSQYLKSGFLVGATPLRDRWVRVNSLEASSKRRAEAAAAHVKTV